MNPLVAAILLSLISAVCYAAAAIMQERLAATVTVEGRHARMRALLASGRWWLAAALQGLGALLHVAALGLGPLTVVQPLGVLTLVLAAPMAAVFVKRPVTAAGWRGILLTSAGLAVILMLTGDASATSRTLSVVQQLSLAAAVAVGLALLVTAGVLLGRRTARLRSAALAVAAGIAYGTASVYVKSVADDWQRASALQLLFLLVVTASLATAGLATAQASFRGAGLTAPLATMTVINPVMAASVGILMLDEGFRYGLAGQLGAAAAGVVAAVGLVRLAAQSTGGRSHDKLPSPVVIHSPSEPPPVVRADDPPRMAPH